MSKEGICLHLKAIQEISRNEVQHLLLKPVAHVETSKICRSGKERIAVQILVVA
jgi:hypothetical protein